jgi:broad specificity phosphatase PhoE
MLFLVRHATSAQPLLRPPGDLTPATREEWLLDHELSARGRAEAALLSTWLARATPPDVVVSSPRLRTLETAALAFPSMPAKTDERLHEWCDDEPAAELRSRVRWLLEEAEERTVWAFTHGGFIRAVVAAMASGDDAARFEATFQTLRRTLAIWNASVTIVGHGPGGLELFAVNLHPDVDALAGRG